MAKAAAPASPSRKMDYKRFSAIRHEARAAFDTIEDWMAEAFGENRDKVLAQLEVEDLDQVLSRRRKGVRYFAAGRSCDQIMFAQWLFPMFEADPNERAYREAVKDVLRVAGGSVKPRTKHKLSFDLGVLYFTADGRGHMYGVVASDDFPVPEAFRYLENILEVYDGIDVSGALDNSNSSFWREEALQRDLFGVKPLAESAWKKVARPEDGECWGPELGDDSDPKRALVSSAEPQAGRPPSTLPSVQRSRTPPRSVHFADPDPATAAQHLREQTQQEPVKSSSWLNWW